MIILAHEGHSDMHGLLHWIGNFHLLVLHFPIALAFTAAAAEVAFQRSKNPVFDHAARVMILATALTAIPTVLFGLALGYEAQYEGILADFYWWHRFCGLLTLMVAFITAYWREYVARDHLYITFLTLLVVLITLTGYLGGSLTFGPGSLLPDFLSS